MKVEDTSIVGSAGDVPCASPGEADPVADLARERFGIEYLMPYQRLVIANVLDAIPPYGDAAGGEGETDRNGLRQLVLLPTGFGKSLCFQLPALLAPGPTLVVYPLLALMADQKRRLDAAGIACALFRGGMDEEERLAQENAVRAGKAKIVITNPESLLSRRLTEFLAEVGLSHIAVDEAHCVSEWGESFRPAYLELGRIIQELDPPAVSAFTATASPTVSEAVSRHLFGETAYRCISADPDRPNIHFSVARTLERTHTLLRLVSGMERPLIVFCSSRDGAKVLAGKIASNLGVDTRFYHAGLERSEKTCVEEWFLHSSDGVLVATCAYGMGVDKKNVRSVVHYDSPPSVEAYLQEAGRAGRDGKSSRAVLIRVPPEPEAPGKSGAQREPEVSRDPEASLRAQTGAGAAVSAARRKALADYADSGSCRREYLMRLMDALHDAPCTGCDVCDGKAVLSPEGLDELRFFFGANGRRFSQADALRLLGQNAALAPPIASTPASEETVAAGGGEPPVCAGSGLLANWPPSEIRSLLAEATKRGCLELASGFPWKDRIGLPARRGKAARTSSRTSFRLMAGAWRRIM